MKNFLFSLSFIAAPVIVLALCAALILSAGQRPESTPDESIANFLEVNKPGGSTIVRVIEVRGINTHAKYVAMGAAIVQIEGKEFLWTWKNPGTKYGTETLTLWEETPAESPK